MKKEEKNFLLKTLFTTGFALIAFAANSILCRLALGDLAIDAAGFTIIRLSSGAIVLFVILVVFNRKGSPPAKGSWISSSMLFIYAAAFSFAYVTLDTGTGALILFGAVQLTMIIAAVISGDKLHLLEWVGVVIAFTGFVYLVIPNVTTPSFTGFILMALAGIAWGFYTIRGKGSKNPLADTTQNFARTLPFIAMLALLTINDIHLSQKGVLLAVFSGGAASGIGYTIWYTALRGLSTTQAAVVQLFVPVLAALGGVMFVSEIISIRLALSALMILGGIALIIFGKYYINKLQMS